MKRVLNIMRSTPRNSKRSGFTLMEMMIVVVISSMMILLGLESFSMISDGFFTGLRKSKLQLDVAGTVSTISGEIQVSRIPPTGYEDFNGIGNPDGNQGDSIRFTVPVDADEDGTVLDANDEIEFGTIDIGDHADWINSETQYYFSPVDENNDGVGDLFVEANENFDMNGDGDQVDTWRLGDLLRLTTKGMRRVFSGSTYIVQVPIGSANLDLNNDGEADPLFEQVIIGAEEMVVLKFTFFRRDESRLNEHMIRRVETSFLLKNPQQ